MKSCQFFFIVLDGAVASTVQPTTGVPTNVIAYTIFDPRTTTTTPPGSLMHEAIFVSGNIVHVDKKICLQVAVCAVAPLPPPPNHLERWDNIAEIY